MNIAKSDRRNFLHFSLSNFTAISFGIHKLKIKNTSFVSFPTDKRLNILCIGAHPGDPEFGCGGTLAKYSNAGHHVSILYLTRGEAGDPLKSYEQSAELRTKEAEQSCRILKASALFAGQVDANTELNKKSIHEITKIIIEQSPDIVFTHWPLDTHQDHQISGLLGFDAWTSTARKFELYFYEVNTGSETMAFTPTDYVDIDQVHVVKKQAMFSHKTQKPEEVYNSYFKQMEEFRGLEAGVKRAEAFIHFKTISDRTGLKGLMNI